MNETHVTLVLGAPSTPRLERPEHDRSEQHSDLLDAVVLGTGRRGGATSRRRVGVDVAPCRFSVRRADRVLVASVLLGAAQGEGGAEAGGGNASGGDGEAGGEELGE